MMMGARMPTRRGRIVVAGVADSQLDLPPGIMERIILREDLYDAIVAVEESPARSPVEAVILGQMHGESAADICRAFERLDPAVSVALATDDPMMADDASGAEMHLMPLPVNRVSVLQLLGAPHIEEASPSDSHTQAHAQVHAQVQSSQPTTHREAESATAREPLAAPAEDVHRAAASVSSATHPVAGNTHPGAADATFGDATPNEGLGDVDLVESVLADPQSLSETAVRLIRQETGWEDVSILPETEGDRSSSAVPIQFGGRHFGYLSAPKATFEALDAWAAWLGRWLALANRQADLHIMAYRDGLTGAWNRRYFDDFLPGVLDDARRHRRMIPIMVFDVDDLKMYNDQFGHDAGDEVLCGVVDVLTSMIRSGDRVCRIGGDEFVVIFSDREGPRQAGSQPIESIESLAQRFHQQVCRLRPSKLGPDAPTVSISAGLATFPWDGADAPTLVRYADQLAMESKRRGKNTLTLGRGSEGPCP